MSYDVIVVGAGPAGSAAAADCASMGLSTLVIDRAAFPRDKPCGGGVLVRSAKAMAVDIAPVVERTIDTARLVSRSGVTFDRRSDEPLCYMTQRTRLDAFLLEHAQRRGANVMERTTLRSVDQRPDRVELSTDSGTLMGRVVVAADGANGVTSRMAGLSVDVAQAVALEGTLRPAGGVGPEWESAGAVHSIACPGGYGWVFPKGDHLNVGVAGWSHVASTLRGRLNELVTGYGWNPADVAGIRGHHVPFRRRGSLLGSGRVLLAGDAAGLADPLSGDGIHAAVVSGRAAARAARDYLSGAASALIGYGREIETGLGQSQLVALQVHHLAHIGLDQFFWLNARMDIVWRGSCAIARGRYSYRGARAVLGPMRVILDLAPTLAGVITWGRLQAAKIRRL